MNYPSAYSIINVRYSETDQMGYVYYGIYASYFEVGRVSLMKKIGINYSELEKKGVGMPVIHYEIKYILPAFYDDTLKIKTKIVNSPSLKVCFEYETYRLIPSNNKYKEKEQLINQAKTTLVFINLKSKKICRPPSYIANVFKDFFKYE